MAYDPARAKEGDRVKNSETGEEYVLQGGQWNPVQVGKFSSAGIGFFDKGVENILNTPAITGDAFAAASTAVPAGIGAGIGSAVNLAKGEPAQLGQQYLDLYEKFNQTSTAQRLRSVPRAPEGVGENLRAAALGEDQRIKTEQAQALFPKAFTGGEFGADAGALLLARRPAALARSNVAKRNVAAAEEFLTSFKRTKRMLDPKVQSALDDVASRTFERLGRGAHNLKTLGVKVSEASLEGAYLAALNDSDPFVSAATSAGTQAAGSLGLFLSTNPRKHLLPAVATAFVTHELWKTFAPGDQSFFESKDFAFHVTAGALTLGALGGLAGSGRLHATAAKFPALADALTAVPRAATENLFRSLRDSSEEGDVLPEQVLERIARDPEFFNANQMNSLSRAMRSEREGAFTKEIERLMRESSDFRKRIATLEEQRRPPEGTEFSGAIDPVRQMQVTTPTHQIQRN